MRPRPGGTGHRMRVSGVLLSFVSHGARFLANAVLLMVLARLWGPEQFGGFAYATAVAALLGLVGGWGLSQKTMRDAAVDPARAGAQVRSGVVAQCLLVPPLLVAVLAIGSFGIGPPPDLLLPLFGAFVALNLAETAAAACRGIGRFDAEARASAFGNGVFFVAGVAAALILPGQEAVALALFAGRLAHAAGAFLMLRAVTAAPGSAGAGALETLRAGAVFAGESVATGAFLQVDTVVVKLVLGEAAAGAYQAGVRFVVVALVAAQAVAGVFVPSLVARLGDRPAFALQARRVFAVFAGLGCAFLVAFAAWGDGIVLAVYGGDYAQTAALAPLLGVLVCVRCLAAGAGIVLLAAGAQTWRLLATLAAMGTYVAAAAIVGPRLGLEGLVAVNVGALAVLLGLYLSGAIRRLRVA